ncbi:GNAT family N-acetyltransferase [Clostridium sp.]|uniref:GNAT family N-acetyltransferase n=1 Tax=Clostridium sp. TaxID=1506 RepID=UPI00307AF480
MSGKGSEARLTHGGDPRFRELVRAMDREYGERFGAAALKCRSCHGLDDIRQACLLLRDGQVVACGAFRAMEEGTAELNRVYVRSEHRRRGCARQVVEVLELQALFQGFGRMVMEIGRDIPEAISLYRKMGYREIETLTIFADNKDTLCMEKELL